MFDIRTPDSHAPGATPQEIFRAELKRTRERRGWTQQQLSDRITELGLSLSRATIAKIETGQRSVLLDEVIAFAVALGVPPSALILGRDSRFIRVTPDLAVHFSAALNWWRGLDPLGPWQRKILRDELGPYVEETEDDRFFYDARPDFEARAEQRLPSVLSLQVLAASAVNFAAFGESLSEVLGPLDTINYALHSLAAYVENEGQMRRGKAIMDREKATTAKKATAKKASTTRTTKKIGAKKAGEKAVAGKKSKASTAAEKAAATRATSRSATHNGKRR